MPLASKSSMPLAPQLFTAQIFISPSTSHLGLWGPDLSDGNCRVSHFSRAGLPQQGLIPSGAFVTCSQPMSPMLAGQSFPTLPHLCTCDGGAHCCIAYYCSACDGRVHCWVGLLATLAKSYICWCSFAEIK